MELIEKIMKLLKEMNYLKLKNCLKKMEIKLKLFIMHLILKEVVKIKISG